MTSIMRWAVPALLAALWAASAGAAETVKIGIFRTASASGAIYYAKEKGYFAAEGIDLDIVLFDAGEAVAVATVGNAIDIGAAGVSAAFYNLASQGTIRVIAGINLDVPAFPSVALVASNKAYEGGLKTFKDLPGHSVALTTIGSTFHYALGLIAEKLGFDPKSMRIIGAQGLPNVASAVVGAQADAAVLTAQFEAALIDKGAVKHIGNVADVAPWQVSVVWVTTATANGRADMLRRFRAAYDKGVHAYYDAFIAPDGTRRDGPGAQEMLALIAKYSGQTPAQIAGGISYVDRDSRIDARDIQHQIEWFRAQGMLKGGNLDAATLIDRRYAVALP